MINLFTLKQKISIICFLIAKGIGIYCTIKVCLFSPQYVPLAILFWIIFLLASIIFALLEKPKEIEDWWRYYRF